MEIGPELLWWELLGLVSPSLNCWTNRECQAPGNINQSAVSQKSISENQDSALPNCLQTSLLEISGWTTSKRRTQFHSSKKPSGPNKRRGSRGNRQPSATNWHLPRAFAICLCKDLGFPCSSVGKESARSAGNQDLIPWLGRSPGEGNGNTLQYPCLENLMDKEPGRLYSPWGHKELDTTEWLTQTHTYSTSQQIWKTQQWPLDWKSCFHSNP